MFKLQFNELRQKFNEEVEISHPDVYGWKTIIKECTEEKFKMFLLFIDYNPNYPDRKLKLITLKKRADEFESFIKMLYLGATRSMFKDFYNMLLEFDYATEVNNEQLDKLIDVFEEHVNSQI